MNASNLGIIHQAIIKRAHDHEHWIDPNIRPAAHNEWNESYFPSLETPPELPRQPLDIKTPAGLVHITVSAIKKRTPGMDSHFGFEGYFLSVLLSPGEHAIWDARGEGAT